MSDTRWCPNCETEVCDWNDGSRIDIDPPGETCCHCHKPVQIRSAQSLADEELGRSYRTWADWYDVPADKSGPEVGADLHRKVVTALRAAQAKAKQVPK